MQGSELVVLKAIGALLDYPRPELLAALPEIADLVKACKLVRPKDRLGLLSLVESLRAAEPLVAEERYVELFDRGRATSLYLFEHVHGEARDRGMAMVELKALYAAAGFELKSRELPDFLPVVLEYLSCRDFAEVKAMLGDCAHILRAIGEALLQRQSEYAAALQALLGIIGEAELNVKAVSKRRAEREDLDAEWHERPAFEPVAGRGV